MANQQGQNGSYAGLVMLPATSAVWGPVLGVQGVILPSLIPVKWRGMGNAGGDWSLVVRGGHWSLLGATPPGNSLGSCGGDHVTPSSAALPGISVFTDALPVHVIGSGSWTWDLHSRKTRLCLPRPGQLTRYFLGHPHGNSVGSLRPLPLEGCLPRGIPILTPD